MFASFNNCLYRRKY